MSKKKIEVIIERLLDEKAGDSWLYKQSAESLTAYIIEEAYELVSAISHQNARLIKDELADVLYQVLLQAYHQSLNLDDIYRYLEEKLKRRHPDVFSDEILDKNSLKASWLEIKSKEKQPVDRLLDHVATGLPSLQKALKMQHIAAKVGFDWPKVQDAIAKLHEEIDELIAAVDQKDQVVITDEMADVLFSSVNVARLLNIDPEVALQQACQKFKRRFNHIEAELKKAKLSLEEASLEQMERLWQEAKRSKSHGK